MDTVSRGAVASFSVEHHAAVGSTNDLALAAARAGADRHWVTADEQLQGRGRSGRLWTSAKGNLFASLALINPCDTQCAPQLGFVAGVALHQAIFDLTIARGGPHKALALKWPNDVLLGGAKLAGILVEGSSSSHGELFAAVGMGINIRSHPEGTPYAATHLAAAGHEITAADVFARLMQTMADTLALWDRGRNFAALRAQWLERAHGIGGPVRVRRPAGDVTGIFEDIDATGRLLLRGDDGVIAIDAGDVFFLREPRTPTAVARGSR